MEYRYFIIVYAYSLDQDLFRNRTCRLRVHLAANISAKLKERKQFLLILFATFRSSLWRFEIVADLGPSGSAGEFSNLNFINVNKPCSIFGTIITRNFISISSFPQHHLDGPDIVIHRVFSGTPSTIHFRLRRFKGPKTCLPRDAFALNPLTSLPAWSPKPPVWQPVKKAYKEYDGTEVVLWMGCGKKLRTSPSDKCFDENTSVEEYIDVRDLLWTISMRPRQWRHLSRACITAAKLLEAEYTTNSSPDIDLCSTHISSSV